MGSVQPERPLRIAIITSFLNEEAYLGRLLESIRAQTRPPDRLLLVDDGSTDASPDMAQAFADANAYATLLRRPPRPPERDRLATAAELKAFQWALDQLEDDWDVVAKMDADIELTPETLRTLEARFSADQRLGVAGPYLSVIGEDGRRRRQRGRPEHVAGPVKFYRRQCYDEMGHVPPILGWDSMDDMMARRVGWRTESIEIPDGDPLHLRPVGTHDGLGRAFRRWGLCAWGSGQHPLHVFLVAAQRLPDSPPVLGSANYVFGYLRAAALRAPRAEPEVREFVQREQVERIRGRILGRRRGPGKEGPQG